MRCVARFSCDEHERAVQKRSSKGLPRHGEEHEPCHALMAHILVDSLHPFAKTESESVPEVLHDLGRQGVELDLLASPFHQSVIDFGHPLGERKF